MPTQVITQTKKDQQESESEESEDEDDRAGAKVIKQVTTTRQVTKVIQKTKESSEEEETEEESEEEAPRNIPQKTVATGKVLSAARVAQDSKQQSVSQPKVPQARPVQLTRPPRPASESEESEEGEEEEEESEEESEEEEMPAKQVNGNTLKNKEVSALQKPTMGQSKQVQQPAQQDSESEDDDDDDEEEEEEEDDERSYTVQQKVVLPSQKIEGRYTSRTTEKQQPFISKRLIETHRLSPINLPPPLPVTSPPQDDDDDDDEEYDDDDVDEEGYGEQFPTRITNLTVSPNKQSKIVTTKTLQGNNSRTVVTKTVVMTTKTTGRPRAPIPVESDDDDDVDEEYNDDENPAHGTETDI